MQTSIAIIYVITLEFLKREKPLMRQSQLSDKLINLRRFVFVLVSHAELSHQTFLRLEILIGFERLTAEVFLIVHNNISK